MAVGTPGDAAWRAFTPGWIRTYHTAKGSRTMDADSRDATSILLEFLRERDVLCPVCGYNLRNLTRPQCPECRKDLVLAVGLKKPRFGWFLVTITPGLFSGIAAGLLLIPLIGQMVLGGGVAP